ncbi:MAG: hypothetical protein H6733_06875 [Alphaproteobacteria bacterium]|nr:hypothetical protein [Alphaproteobacteria bacterium]
MTSVDLDPRSARALFLAAHHAAWSGAYFQRVMLVAQLAQHPDDAVAAYRDRLFAALKQEGAAVGPLVVLADTIARAHGLDLPPRPAVPAAWEPWSRALRQGLWGRVDLKKPDAAPLPFGWELGMLRTTLAVLVTLIEIQNAGVDKLHGIVAGIHDLGDGTERWTTAVLQLRKLPQAALFVDDYKPLKAELQRLARSQITPGDGAALTELDRGARRLLVAMAGMERQATRALPAVA